MKKAISILLIAGFLVQSTSQLLIMVSFKIRQDYIAANLCINRFDAIPLCKGSCYLENQLSQEQQQQQKYPELKNRDINLFCQHMATATLKQPLASDPALGYPVLSSSFISSEYLRSVFRPPGAVM